MKTRFDGLSELISRRSRVKLLKAVREILGSNQKLSQEFNVNRSTVYRWFKNEKVHPSNSSTEKILSILKKFDPDTTKNILMNELKEYERLIEREF